MDEVIADYLDVTCPPDSFQRSDLTPIFDQIDGIWRHDKSVHTFHTTDGGVFKFGCGRGFQRLSASGRVLAHFRAQGIFREYLALLSGVPVTVTRLDAALDRPEHGPDVLPGLFRQHRSGYAFGRKAVEVVQIMEENFEGALTGTLHFGDRRRHKLTACIYDKQHEAFKKRKEILPSRVRYELRANREVGCTLRDAESPASFFYHHMSPDFLPRPDGVPDWSPAGAFWSSRVVGRLPADRAKYLVESCGDLETLARLALEIGREGIPFVAGLVRKRIESIAAGVESERSTGADGLESSRESVTVT